MGARRAGDAKSGSPQKPKGWEAGLASSHRRVRALGHLDPQEVRDWAARNLGRGRDDGGAVWGGCSESQKAEVGKLYSLISEGMRSSLAAWGPGTQRDFRGRTRYRNLQSPLLKT